MPESSHSSKNCVDQELERLIPLAKQGDVAARNRLAEILRPRLRNFAASRLPHIVRHRADASEVAQDALLDIDQTLQDFRGTSAGELIAAAFWKVRAEIKKLIERHVEAAKRSVQLEVNPSDAALALVDAAASGSSPSAAAIRNEEREYFFQEIELLPEEENRVMELLYMGELTPDDVAAALGIVVEDVEKIRFKALKRIAKRAAQQRSQESK